MVEYHLAKVAVAGSSPVARSTLMREQKPAEVRRVFHGATLRRRQGR